MTDQQQKWIEQLSHCSFYPGSFDKRFCRDLAGFPPEKELTEKQAACLERMAYKYRVQRGDAKMARPPGAMPDQSEADQEALRAWNEGKPL